MKKEEGEYRRLKWAFFLLKFGREDSERLE